MNLLNSFISRIFNRKRYFIVFYEVYSINMLSKGHMTFYSMKYYLNYLSTVKTIQKRLNVQKDPILTNIIELSKNDYEVFMQE